MNVIVVHISRDHGSCYVGLLLGGNLDRCGGVQGFLAGGALLHVGLDFVALGLIGTGIGVLTSVHALTIALGPIDGHMNVIVVHIGRDHGSCYVEFFGNRLGPSNGFATGQVIVAIGCNGDHDNAHTLINSNHAVNEFNDLAIDRHHHGNVLVAGIVDSNLAVLVGIADNNLTAQVLRRNDLQCRNNELSSCYAVSLTINVRKGSQLDALILLRADNGIGIINDIEVAEEGNFALAHGLKDVGLVTTSNMNLGSRRQYGSFARYSHVANDLMALTAGAAHATGITARAGRLASDNDITAGKVG